MPHTHPVLIAEDDEDTIFFIERALRKIGVKNPLQFVSNGAEAVDYLKKNKHQKPPRVVLLDIKMPGADGFDVLKWVRASAVFSRLPVVMFSDSSELRDVNRAYDLGANSYVVKPTDPDRMRDLILKINDYWININQEATAP